MLNSPRRIAVVVLATLSGAALQAWADVPEAGSLGLLVGVLVAAFVPNRKSGCRIR